jgi:hypothetical protein
LIGRQDLPGQDRVFIKSGLEVKNEKACIIGLFPVLNMTKPRSHNADAKNRFQPAIPITFSDKAFDQPIHLRFPLSHAEKGHPEIFILF